MAVFRVLTRTLANPRYRPGIKRGLWSIPTFETGLMFVVNVVSPDFVGTASTSIDIPSLRVTSIVDRRLIDVMVEASRSVRVDEIPTNLPFKQHGWVDHIPSDETVVRCSKCTEPQTAWVVTIDTNLQPARIICVRCGTVVKFARRSIVHSLVGRA